MNFIGACIRHPVSVSVGVLLVVLFGVISLYRMPMQLTPEVDTPRISVETRWPGASPREVEREIIQEQEEQLRGVEGVRKLTSESSDSMGRITLEFAVGTDLKAALVQVSTRLEQVPVYPENADKPVISLADMMGRSIAWFVLMPKPPTDVEIDAFETQHPELAGVLQPIREAHINELRSIRLREAVKEHQELSALLPPPLEIEKEKRFVEDVIEARFERVKGVADAGVNGGLDPEMQVIVDPNRLAARQLTIADVRRALRDENKDTSGGDFSEGKRRWVVRTLGQFRSPEQVASVLIERRDGKPIYVRDVADVVQGFRKPERIMRHLGTPGISMNVQRENGSNVMEVMAGLKAATRELNEGVLRQRGLFLEQVYDETDYIHSAIGLVKSNIWVGGFLTILTLIVFLRNGRSTLIIGLAIPVSIVGTFLMLELMGRSLNVISLAGIAFAVGMLVDNSIVILENIYRRRQLGESTLQASLRGAAEVWGAVAASTLTTLAVFLPVLFVKEEVGQLFRDIALAISSAVGLSLLVSILVIPVAASRVLASKKETLARLDAATDDGELAGSNGHQASEGTGPMDADITALGLTARWLDRLLWPLTAFGRGFISWIVGANAWLQGGVTRRLVVVGGMTAASLLLSYILLPKVEYLPTGNRNLVIGRLLPPAGYNVEHMMEIGRQIEEQVRPYWEVKAGTPEAEELPYPPIGDFFYFARGREMFIGTRAAEPLRARELEPLIKSTAAHIPDVIMTARQTSLFERGLGAGRSIDVEITGPNLEELCRLGKKAMTILPEKMPGVQLFPRPSLDLSSPEIHVIPKSEQAADMGMSATDLGYAVDALVDGAYAADYTLGADKIDLVISGRGYGDYRTQNLASLPIATPNGQVVRLEALAHVQVRTGPEQINHSERQRTITIQVSPPADVPLADALDIVNSEIVRPFFESGELKAGYQINVTGTADKLRDTWRSLRYNLLLAVLITYLLMAALFESWLHPLVIMMSVPLGAVGGILGLALLNVFFMQSLDVLTMLGFVILVGTVVNNPILIVHQSLNHIRDDGMAPREAILESVRNRIRPIFMTTLTTILGLLPLVLFPGAGSELYRGLGAVLLGGLLISTLFTLILVPTLFSLVLDAQDWLRRCLLGSSAEITPPARSDRRGELPVERPSLVPLS
jgi:HAE1 family hydrophobic/amphiphilic exporter-1